MNLPTYRRSGQQLWTAQEIDYLNTHISDGYQSIADALGRTLASVIQKYSTLHRVDKSISPADITAIRNMRRQKKPKKTIQTISNELGLTVWMVRKIIKENNL